MSIITKIICQHPAEHRTHMKLGDYTDMRGSSGFYMRRYTITCGKCGRTMNRLADFIPNPHK